MRIKCEIYFLIYKKPPHEIIFVSQLLCPSFSNSFFSITTMANDFSNKRHDVQYSVACRVCDQVFRSNRALVTHMESHEGASIRRHYSEPFNPQGQFLWYSSPPGFHVPYDTQNMNDARIFQPQPHPRAMLQLTRNQIPSHVLPNPPVYQLEHLEEESSNDGTKPYIVQLEKPIKKKDDDNSAVPMLD